VTNDNNILNILNFLLENRNLNFLGNKYPMLIRRISTRFLPTNTANMDEYYNFLISNPDEIDILINLLTINASHFFRNSQVWECFSNKILIQLMDEKNNSNENSFRIWSAGCSTGEEPYSIALLIKEIQMNAMNDFPIHIFATDIDPPVLKKAIKAEYLENSIKNVKFSLFKKYFSETDNVYSLNPEIKKMVKFSFFDLLDENNYIPPDSIFGNFDVVFCRNVLIYFTPDFQDIIINKLLRSLKPNGFLVLGKTETINPKYKQKLQFFNMCCKIYKKM